MTALLFDLDALPGLLGCWCRGLMHVVVPRPCFVERPFNFQRMLVNLLDQFGGLSALVAQRINLSLIFLQGSGFGQSLDLAQIPEQLQRLAIHQHSLRLKAAKAVSEQRFFQALLRYSHVSRDTRRLYTKGRFRSMGECPRPRGALGKRALEPRHYFSSQRPLVFRSGSIQRFLELFRNAHVNRRIVSGHLSLAHKKPLHTLCTVHRINPVHRTCIEH